VGKSLLGLRGPRGEDAERALTRGLETCQPDRRLADARLAFEHERARIPAGHVQERVQRGDLVVPAYDLDCHPAADRDRQQARFRGLACQRPVTAPSAS
jgi:hypothetical protein